MPKLAQSVLIIEARFYDDIANELVREQPTRFASAVSVSSALLCQVPWKFLSR